jgi:hypothetical protein
MNSPRRQYTPAVLLVIGTSQRHQRVRGSQNVYGVGNAAMVGKNLDETGRPPGRR